MHPLDMLLQELNSQNSENETDNNARDPSRENSPGGEAQSSPMSPSTKQRRVRMVRILSSSSLKKQTIKTSPCKYCHRFRFGRAQLEAHLKENEICASLYMRAEKVRNLDAVLVKQFKCISCSSNGTFQLKRHLGFV